MKQESTVLYDAPGPRARRVTLISGLVATVLVVAVGYLFIYRTLADAGQFHGDLWGPLLSPSNENFAPLWQNLLLPGLKNTLRAAAFAVASSLVFGTLLAVARIQIKAFMRRRFTGLGRAAVLPLRGLSWVLNTITRLFVEVFRGMPVVITIFFVARALPEFGINFADPVWYLVIGLTLYNMVVIAEILRSGMEGLPFGQREAASAIGLTSFQTTRLILLPQAFRIMLPALISQLVVVLKDSSLGFIISYPELLRQASIAIQTLSNPIQMYFLVAVIYIAVNYSLSKLAEYVQRRLARGRKTAGIALPEKTAAELEAEVAAGGAGVAA
jgi:glutamate transport system permease protein